MPCDRFAKLLRRRGGERRGELCRRRYAPTPCHPIVSVPVFPRPGFGPLPGKRTRRLAAWRRPEALSSAVQHSRFGGFRSSTQDGSHRGKTPDTPIDFIISLGPFYPVKIMGIARLRGKHPVPNIRSIPTLPYRTRVRPRTHSRTFYVKKRQDLKEFALTILCFH